MKLQSSQITGDSAVYWTACSGQQQISNGSHKWSSARGIHCPPHLVQQFGNVSISLRYHCLLAARHGTDKWGYGRLDTISSTLVFRNTRALLRYKDRLLGYGILIIGITLSSETLNFIMGVPILVRWHLYAETPPPPPLNSQIISRVVPKYCSKKASCSSLEYIINALGNGFRMKMWGIADDNSTLCKWLWFGISYVLLQCGCNY